jgi:hypothetical protein
MTTHSQNEKQPSPASALPRVAAGVLHRKCACGGSAGLSGQCQDCQDKSLQRKASGSNEVSEAPPIVHEVLRSEGQPLDSETRATFEPRFGHDFGRVRVHDAQPSSLVVAPSGSASEQEADYVADRVVQQTRRPAPQLSESGLVDFSQVRIHSDSQAAESARAVDALAYTVGSHIVFASEQYNPGTSSGQHLLAHELTHVMQQSTGVQRSPALQRKKADVSILADGECKDPKSIALSAAYGARMVRVALDWFLNASDRVNEVRLKALLRANFGSDSSETQSAVHNRLVRMSASLERAQSAGLTFSCVDSKYEGCKKHIAEAQRGREHIVLCPQWFEDVQFNGTNFGAHSLVHESAHIAGAVEKDEVYQNKIYGEMSSGQCFLNRSVGADPLNNADNYAWFVSCLVLPSDAAVFPGMDITIPAQGKTAPAQGGGGGKK